MALGPALKLVSSKPGPDGVYNLRCLFCGSQGVEIEDVREISPSGGVKGNIFLHISFGDTAVFEYGAHCPGCGKSYRQACPRDRMLKLLRSAQ